MVRGIGKYWYRYAADKAYRVQTGASCSLFRGVFAHMRGEVVEPAGGETGVPRCLAEVHEAAQSSAKYANILPPRDRNEKKPPHNGSKRTIPLRGIIANPKHS
jgi:hypothetical protein